MLFLILCHFTLTTALYFDDVDLTIPNATLFTSYYGPNANYMFGYTVSNLGDINGDNIDDFIIGAPTTSLFPGLAYVIYGQKTGLPSIDFSALTSAQGFRIQGESNSDILGAGTGSAGDFNGDGIKDIIVAAPYVSPGGAVYVIFGSKTPFPDIILPGGLVGRGFKISGTVVSGILGIPVNCAGDVNGDGFDDVIVGAYGENFNGANSGSVYVIFGRNTSIIDLIVPTQLTSSRGFYVQGNPGDRLGSSAGGAGDINADGVQDIIIGTNNAAAVIGQVYIIFGRKTGFQNYQLNLAYSSAEVNILQGANVGDSFGSAVGKAGDVNGDGIDDIVISALKVSVTGKTNVGAVYVIFGRKNGLFNMNMATDLDSTKGFVIYGANQEDKIGSAVTKAGDFNGDGIDDIFFGAHTVTVSGKLNAGLAYVIYGRKTGITDIDLNGLDKTHGFMIQGTAQLSQLGAAVSGGGDFNGDGGPDIIVGAVLNLNPLGQVTGSAFVLYGIPPPPKPTPTVETIVEAQSAGALANQAGAMILFFGQVNNGLPLLFCFLVEVLYYVRYLEIKYPPRLRYMLEQPDPEYLSIDYITSAPEQLEEYLPSLDVPEKFEFYGFQSSFLLNFWPSIMMFFIVLAIIIIALLLEHATRSKKWVNSLCLKFKQSMKWNYLIAMFTGYYNDIALHTFLETRTVKFDSFLSGLSFVVCILMNTLAGFMLIKIFLIIRKVRAKTDQVRINKTSTPEELEKLKNDLQDYEVIFNGYKADDFLQQSYLLLYSLRLYIFYVIVAYPYAHPIVQTSIITVMGFITLAYVIFKRPFEDTKDFIMSIVQESILQIVNISAFVLAVTDSENKQTDEVRVVFGDIIIGCNIAFMIVGLTYTMLMLILMLATFYKYIKKKCTEKKRRSTTKGYKPRRRDIIPSPSQNNSSVNESHYGLNLNGSSFINSDNALHNRSDIHLTEIISLDEVGSRPKKNSHGLRHHSAMSNVTSNLHHQKKGNQPNSRVSEERRKDFGDLEYLSNIESISYSQGNRMKAKKASPFSRRDKTVHKYN